MKHLFLLSIILLSVAFLIVVPTKTVIKDVEVSYLDTETYTDQEPYTAMEITYVKETWQEVHTASEGHESPEGYYWKTCAAPCSCSHYTSNPETIPSYYCDECSCPKSGVYEQSRTDPKYQWVTKYREVSKTRNVTKTRIEPEPVEVNWIIGFQTPYTFHLINPTITPPATNPSSINPVITTITPAIATITTSSTHPWTCFSSGNYPLDTEPRTPIVYEQNDPDTPHYRSLPTPLPTPSYNGGTMLTDPIIGTFIFDPTQFKSTEVERMDYFSTLSSSEFYYVVPLDISPDIKWTFRDDGVLLFFQNNITCSDSSLRRFWRNTSGNFLRSGTWKVLESGKDKTTYQIKWGCSVQNIHDYTVTYDKNGVSLTKPNILKMIKID